MTHNTCTLCGEIKPHEEFNKHKAMTKGILNQCKACTFHRTKMDKRRQCYKHKQRALIMFGNTCSDCGNAYHYSAMDFHHTDPTTKELNIGRALGRVAWRRVEAELKKCELLCSNCHRVRHHKDKEFKEEV